MLYCYLKYILMIILRLFEDAHFRFDTYNYVWAIFWIECISYCIKLFFSRLINCFSFLYFYNWIRFLPNYVFIRFILIWHCLSNQRVGKTFPSQIWICSFLIDKKFGHSTVFSKNTLKHFLNENNRFNVICQLCLGLGFFMKESVLIHKTPFSNEIIFFNNTATVLFINSLSFYFCSKTKNWHLKNKINLNKCSSWNILILKNKIYLSFCRSMAVPRQHQSSTRSWPKALTLNPASSTKKLTKSFRFSLTAETEIEKKNRFANFDSKYIHFEERTF